MALDPERAERDRQIINDRIAGLTYAKLAEKYSLSTSTIHGIVEDHVKNTIKPAAEHLVQLEVIRLERLLSALEPKIEAGDPRAIEVAIKIGESLRKLTGIDAASKVTVEHSISDQEDRIAQMLKKASQVNTDESE